MLEDPEHHLSELADCLIQSSRPIGFLLGAGCPCSVKDAAGKPLIADIAGLTNSVAAALEGGSNGPAWASLIATCTEDGEAKPTIEQMLDRIRGLRSYAGSATMRGLTKKQLETLEQSVCEHIAQVASVDLPDGMTSYRSLAIWVKANKRVEAVEVFTTNYDLLAEQAFEQAQVPVFDGFVGTHRPFFDVESVSTEALPSRWARIWKLHGSINWHRDVARKRIYRSDKGGSAVIHPSNLKYEESRKLPYLALMERLRRFLRQGHPIVICCGYSFRDQHINEVLMDTLGANPHAMVFGLLFGPLGGYPEAMGIARQVTNLRLYATDACVTGARSRGWVVQKSKPDDQFPTGLIEWTEGAPPAVPGWHASVHIGDFGRLGELLDHLSKGRYVDASKAGMT